MWIPVMVKMREDRGLNKPMRCDGLNDVTFLHTTVVAAAALGEAGRFGERVHFSFHTLCS